MSKRRFCTQPPSINNFFATLRCFHSHLFFALLRIKARAGSSQRTSFKHSYSCFAAHFSNKLFWPAAGAFSLRLSGKHISCQCFCRLRISMSANRPLNTQITGLTHHCSWRSSYLPPRLNFSNLFHPSFLLLLIPFSRPDSLCPILRGQSREIFIHRKTKGLHEKGQRGRTLFARCCCRLSPQFQSFRWSHHHCMNSHVLAGTTPARNNFSTPTLM